MKQQTIIWTALPNGLTKYDGSLRLSVFISPRLQTDEGLPLPRLAQFPDFLNWPAKVADATFSVRFGNGQPVPATRVPHPNAEEGPELWRALFDEQTYVRPHEFPELGDRIIRSFPVQVRADSLVISISAPLDSSSDAFLSPLFISAEIMASVPSRARMSPVFSL